MEIKFYGLSKLLGERKLNFYHSNICNSKKLTNFNFTALPAIIKPKTEKFKIFVPFGVYVWMYVYLVEFFSR